MDNTNQDGSSQWQTTSATDMNPLILNFVAKKAQSTASKKLGYRDRMTVYLQQRKRKGGVGGGGGGGAVAKSQFAAN